MFPVVNEIKLALLGSFRHAIIASKVGLVKCDHCTDVWNDLKVASCKCDKQTESDMGNERCGATDLSPYGLWQPG